MTQESSARHVLVFEPDARGHAEEWLLHILRFLREARGLSVTMVVPPSLASAVAKDPAAQGVSRLSILPLAEREIRLCLHPKLAVSAFARWWFMRRYLARAGASEGIFMCVDTLSLPLALGVGFGGVKASGILFRPSVHYASFGRSAPNFRERIRDARKRVLYPLMLRNGALEQIHSLDPYFPRYARDRYVWGGKVSDLADPVNDRGPQPASGKSASPFPPNRVGFLLFGELTERKGILELLAACERLDALAAHRMAILLAGRVDPALRSRVSERIAAVRARHPDLWLEVDDRRLGFDELSAAVQACDVVLAPYQRFVGSSGVLMWAAQAEKPVITQDYGLLSRLTREFGLGLAVNTSSADELARAMTRAVNDGPRALIDTLRARRFIRERDGRLFAAKLLRVSTRTVAVGGRTIAAESHNTTATFETQGGHTTLRLPRDIVGTC